jgi:hypothetical protein
MGKEKGISIESDVVRGVAAKGEGVMDRPRKRRAP